MIRRRSAFLVAALQPMLVLFGMAPIHAQNAPATDPIIQSVVAAGYGGLQVTWTALTDATGYEVRYEMQSDPLVGTIHGETDIIENLGNVFSYWITGLEHDARYLVAVRGYNTAGNGPWTAPVDGTTIPATPPEQTQGLELAAGDSSRPRGTRPTATASTSTPTAWRSPATTGSGLPGTRWAPAPSTRSAG